MQPLLKVSNLHLHFKLFEGDAHVLNGINLEVGRGERVAIVGESGCGKTVTLRLIMGLLQQRNMRSTGQIMFDGLDMLSTPQSKLRELRGRRMCPIFQDPMASLNPTFTILDQLGTVIRRSGKKNKTEIYNLAVSILKQVAIADPERVLSAYPFQLSGGLNQRVLIAMALVNKPDLILADEPGTALDVTVQEQTLRLMRQLTEELNSAVLLITHNLGVVREFADRVYVMYAGNVVEEGSTASIFTQPKHPYTQALMNSVQPKLSGSGLPQGIDGFIPDYTKPPSGCRFHPRCTQATSECQQPQPLYQVGPQRVACRLYKDFIHG